MNKRITSLALVFVMVLSLLATAVPVLAAPIESTQLKLTANKSSASPGDTITFTVTLGPVTDLGTIQMVVNVPEGLTYVENSGKLAEGLKETLGFDLVEWTEAADRIYAGEYPGSMISGVSLADYNSDTDTVLATFDCTVDEDASGDLQLGLYNLEFYSCETWNDHTDRFSVVPATIAVTAAPKPATGITLDKDKLTLTVGGTETLMATVTPSDTTDTVAWSSNKPEVATVDPTTGEVTAVAPGEAIITAKAGEKTATCTVKVNCAHNLETVSAKESNCTDKGWDEYKKCTLCGALFDTSGGSIEGIPYRPLDPDAHTFGSWIDEVPANCTNTGTKEHKDCTLCSKHFDNAGVEITDLTIPTNDDHDFNLGEWGYKESDGHAHVCKYNPAHHDTVVTHSFGDDDTCDICGYERTHVCANHLSYVPPVDPDCTNPGNIEHYKCSCNKLYADDTANTPLTEDQVKLDARGHDWKDATCTDPKTCKRCDTTEGEALGHDWKDATCTDPKTCKRCDITDGEALGHDWKDATCTDPKTCKRCGETEGAALGHNWAAEWSSDADNHWHACTLCGAKKDEDAHDPGPAATEDTPQTCIDCGYVIAPATGHVCADHLTKVEAKPATCTNPGNKEHYKCSNSSCGKLFWDLAATEEITDPTGVIIKATGHDYTKEITDAAHKRSTAADCREYDTYWYTCANDDSHSAADDPSAADKYYNGDKGAHVFGTEWVACGKTGHAHECKYHEGVYDTVQPHVPGAPATETTSQDCKECGFEIRSAIGHVHFKHLTKVEERKATCTTDGNKEHYKCSCGKLFKDTAANEMISASRVIIKAKGHDYTKQITDAAHKRSTAADCREYDTYWYTCANDDSHSAADDPSAADKYYNGDKGAHAFGTEWIVCSESGHAHECKYHEGVYDAIQPHTPDHKDGATFDHPVLCTACGYVIEEQLEEGTIHVEVPFKLIVKKAGETNPGKEIFKFMIDNFGVSTDYSIIKDTIETDGEKTYDGSFVFTIKERYADNLSDGFIIGLLKGSTEDWTYDETKFYAQPILSYSRDSVVGWKFCTLNENGTPDYENMVEEITFTNNYGDDKNDNNTYLVLWIVLACVSGSAIAGAIIIYKKRKLNAR